MLLLLHHSIQVTAYKEKTSFKNFTFPGEGIIAFCCTQDNYHITQNYNLVMVFIWRLLWFKEMCVGVKLTRGELVMINGQADWAKVCPDSW